jgi:hypothetical protein
VPGEVTLELSAYKWDSPAQMERMLKNVLAQAPWCIASKPINIQFIPEVNKVKISFSLLDHVYIKLVKDRLVNSLEKLEKGS